MSRMLSTDLSVPAWAQVHVTELHAKLAAAQAGQQAAREALQAAELSLQKEVATRRVLEGSLERAQRELAEANEDR